MQCSVPHVRRHTTATKRCLRSVPQMSIVITACTSDNPPPLGYTHPPPHPHTCVMSYTPASTGADDVGGAAEPAGPPPPCPACQVGVAAVAWHGDRGSGGRWGWRSGCNAPLAPGCHWAAITSWGLHPGHALQCLAGDGGKRRGKGTQQLDEWCCSSKVQPASVPLSLTLIHPHNSQAMLSCRAPHTWPELSRQLPGTPAASFRSPPAHLHSTQFQQPLAARWWAAMDDRAARVNQAHLGS